MRVVNDLVFLLNLSLHYQNLEPYYWINDLDLKVISIIIKFIIQFG